MWTNKDIRHILPVIFQLSANMSYKNRTIETSNQHSVSPITKSRALEASSTVKHVGLASDEKLKWSKELANRLGAQAEHQPLLTHLSSCFMRSPSGAVPMACANRSMLSGVWSWRHDNHNTTGEPADEDTPSLLVPARELIVGCTDFLWKEILSHANLPWHILLNMIRIKLLALILVWLEK